MSVALRFYDPFDYESTSAVLYFNATTRLSRSVSAEVPRYPVDRHVDMGDHYVPSNYRYNISGIISRADITSLPSMGWITLDIESGLAETGESYLVNWSPTFDRVEIANSSSKGAAFMRKVLPDFIGQMFDSNTTIQVDERSVPWSYQEVRQVLEFAVRGLTYNKELERWEVTPKAVELIKLDKRGNVQEKIRDNLLITNIVDDESAERGDALYLDLELEEVRTSDLMHAELSVAVSEAIAKAAKERDNKGRADSAETTLDLKTLVVKLPELVVDTFTGGGR